MKKISRKSFDNFFKILSDPAEGYGHLVNKIMAKDGAKRWSLDLRLALGAGLSNQLMQIFSSSSSSSSCSDSNSRQLSPEKDRKHTDGLTLIREYSSGCSRLASIQIRPRLHGAPPG